MDSQPVSYPTCRFITQEKNNPEMNWIIADLGGSTAKPSTDRSPSFKKQQIKRGSGEDKNIASRYEMAQIVYVSEMRAKCAHVKKLTNNT